MSYVNQLSNWYRKEKTISTAYSEMQNTTSDNSVDYAIELVIRHNKKRCARYWSAKSREIREETLIPLVGLAFKIIGGSTQSEKLRCLLKEKLEIERPGLNVIPLE